MAVPLSRLRMTYRTFHLLMPAHSYSITVLLLPFIVLLGACDKKPSSKSKSQDAEDASTAEAMVDASAFKPIRIDCGGDGDKDEKTGVFWEPDKQYAKKGKKYRFSNKPIIKQLKDGATRGVYQTVRRRNVLYQISKVPDGIYKVRFHFMDGKAQRKRSMDFWVEGQPIIQNFSLAEFAEGSAKGFIFEDIVEVTGGDGMEIKGSKGRGDDVFISAIEVLAAPAGAKPSKVDHSKDQAPADLAGDLRKFGGGPVRLVWTRTEEEEDFYVKGPTGRLFGIDSESGEGERVILSELRSYAMPMLTPDGHKVVFTDQGQGKCYEVGFDGTGLRELVDGFATDLWQDPRTGKTWVYVRTGWRNINAPIVRYDLADLSVQETVWKQAAVGIPQASWFTVSGDGQFAADAFPWPQCGLAYLGDGDFKFMGKGCWPSVAPDTSRKFFYFLGNHTAVEFFDSPESKPRSVRLSTIPGWAGRKLYHPRWTNHVRYITATAPQWMPETELYLGKFDESFGGIESWFRVTYNQTADFFGDAWFGSAHQKESASKPSVPEPAHLAVTPEKGAAGLVFVWDNERARNAVLDAQGKVARSWNLRYDGETRPNRWYAADIKKGGLLPPDDAGEVVGEAIAKTGEITLTLEADNYVTDASGDGMLAYLGGEKGDAALTVEQVAGKFLARARAADGTMAEVDLGPVADGAAVQFVITYGKGLLKGFRNGVETASVSAQCTLSGWHPGTLVFGRDPQESRRWRGCLECLRILDRTLETAEIAQMHKEFTEERSERVPAVRVVVDAELVQASEPSDPEAIAPYTRSLAENQYKVKKVISGELADETIVVLQWVILGGEPVDGAEKMEGHTYRLVIEPVEDHAELSGEHRSTDLFDGTSRVFYDVES